MTIWSPALDRDAGPLYLSIADAIAEAVAAGELAAGEKLPTHRQLAADLEVTVGTVSRAYSEAERRGLVRGEVGRGTFVRAYAEGGDGVGGFPPGAVDGRRFVDLGFNAPAPVEGRAESRDLARALNEIAAAPRLGCFLDYQAYSGLADHRAVAAQWISELGVEAVAERVSVTCGAQHAMVVVFATLTRPGDLVMTEAVTYPGMKALAALLNLGLEGLALDDEGVRPDAFEAACRSGRSEILYTVPTIQNPTGVVMSPERREALAAIARRHGITIVEDDVHARLPSGKVKPLAAYAPERTYYIASTSKSLAPGLRVGYLLAPDGADEARLGASLWSTTWMAPPLMVEVASRWISDGTAERIVASRRAEAAARQRLAAERLAPYRRSAHPEGYHLWLQVPEPWAADDFAVRARARGVNVNPPAVFAVGRDAAPHAVRLCLGAPRQREELDGALVTVAELLAAGPGAGAFVV